MLRGREKEELHLPECFEKTHAAAAPHPFHDRTRPCDDVTEVTSRRPERGWGREADRAGVVRLSWRLLGAGERVSGQAAERARAGRRERRVARRRAGARPRRNHSRRGQPEPGAAGSPPPLGRTVPGVSPCGGRRRRLTGPGRTAGGCHLRRGAGAAAGSSEPGPGARDRRAEEGREAAAAQATGRQRRRHHVIPQSGQEADGHGRGQAH